MNIEQTKGVGQTLDCFCKGIEFTQSHRPEETIPDSRSYDKCEPGLLRNGKAKKFKKLVNILSNLNGKEY